jgi:hypothetical protein
MADEKVNYVSDEKTWDRFNVHTFNCHRRADRRVEGWLRRDGWAEEWIPIYILPASGRWSHSLPR